MIIIKNFPNYSIDKKGKVMNIITKKEKKPSIYKVGYYYLTLYNKGKIRTVALHRLLAETFIPNIENKRTVNHKDGNKLNNSLSNLEWATDAENIQHAYDTGLQPYKRKIEESKYEDILLNRFFKGEYLTHIANTIDNSLATLSMNLKEIATKLGILDEYNEELNRQKLERNKESGVKKRKSCILQMLDKDTNEVLKTFNNVTEAKDYLKVKSCGPISNACSGRQKRAYGFKWKKFTSETIPTGSTPK